MDCLTTNKIINQKKDYLKLLTQRIINRAAVKDCFQTYLTKLEPPAIKLTSLTSDTLLNELESFALLQLFLSIYCSNYYNYVSIQSINENNNNITTLFIYLHYVLFQQKRVKQLKSPISPLLIILPHTILTAPPSIHNFLSTLHSATVILLSFSCMILILLFYFF